MQMIAIVDRNDQHTFGTYAELDAAIEHLKVYRSWGHDAVIADLWSKDREILVDLSITGLDK